MNNNSLSTIKNAQEILNAYQIYHNRQMWLTHPDGSFGDGYTWLPSNAERRSCCSKALMPTRGSSMRLLEHCRSAEHVAHLCLVDPALLTQFVKVIEANQPESEQSINPSMIVAA